MKTIIKEINLLDIEDIEEALSSYIGKKISISDISCSITRCFSASSGNPFGLFLNFDVDGRDESIDDLFWDDDKKCHCWKGKELGWEEPYPLIEEIFNFDTSAFKSFFAGED